MGTYAKGEQMSCQCEARDNMRLAALGIFLWFAGVCWTGANAYAVEYPIYTWSFWALFGLLYAPIAWFVCGIWQIHQEEKGSK